MKQLYDYLSQKMTISKEDWDFISSRVHLQKIKKKEYIIKKGKIERTISFIKQGIVRFFIEQPKEDVTFDFGFPNTLISSYSSLLKQEPSNCYLQSLTPTTLLSISHNDLDLIYKETLCGHALGRIFAEEFFLYKSKREEDFLTLSPKERYLQLFKEQPELIQNIPGKYIASYIGITPQALSRIRSNL